MLKNLSPKALSLAFTIAISGVFLGSTFTVSSFAMEEEQEFKNSKNGIVRNWLNNLAKTAIKNHAADEDRLKRDVRRIASVRLGTCYDSLENSQVYVIESLFHYTMGSNNSELIFVFSPIISAEFFSCDLDDPVNVLVKHFKDSFLDREYHPKCYLDQNWGDSPKYHFSPNDFEKRNNIKSTNLSFHKSCFKALWHAASEFDLKGFKKAVRDSEFEIYKAIYCDQTSIFSCFPLDIKNIIFLENTLTY